MHDYLTAPPRLGSRGFAPKSVAERFWAKVRKTDGCWFWTGGTRRGYGEIGVGSSVDGTRRIETATRVSWVLHVGPIPEGMGVLHKCDNPPCVRPDHLFLGRQLENTQDCVRKGRAKQGPGFTATDQRGEANLAATLTVEQIREIRQLYVGDRRDHAHSAWALAKRYGVSYGHIWNIVKRKRWTHL